MKKLILSIGLLLAVAGFSYGQTGAKKDTTKKEVKKPAATTANPTKKDGTPDMRYKANKNAKVADTTVHRKKDGTADKRYKENKK